MKLGHAIIIGSLLLPIGMKSEGQLTLPANSYIGTIAGDGTQGTLGNGGPALNSELNFISGLAFDGLGNLFILDQCVVREVSVTTGKINLVAGNGTCGYAGDGGTATSAEIRPYFSSKIEQKSEGSIAFDSAGNLYIADGENNRIRKVNLTTGIISTIAGTGTAGYSGDGGVATSAELSTPSSIAIDSQGNVYVTDSNNNRIRKVTALTGVITTVAGTGIDGYSGDGGAATSAEIAEPYGIATDLQGDVYFIDTDNRRIRSVSATTGIISTIAGTGSSGYSGDGGLATSAMLNEPSGIAIDPFNNIYIADTGNFRVRYINSTTKKISTIAGDGTQGFTGDGGTATGAEIYCYGGIAVNPAGSFAFSDSAAFRVRAVGGPGVTGVINPKYAIVGVTYAPPGPSSYVQYSDSTYVGSTTMLSNSFTSAESLSVSVFDGIKAWGASNGFTGTSTSTATEMSTSSSTVTVSIQSTTTDKTTGTPNAFSPVDHDYDIIWLWLNPAIVMTVTPNNPSTISWGGYAYDIADSDVVDVYPVYVGQLNGHLSIDPSTQKELSRSWATGQTWPNGQGPALTTTDYTAILGADPFSNASYMVTINPDSSPSTTTDGRFSLSNSNQAIDYVQAPNNGGIVTEGYTNVYTDTNTTAQSTQYSYQQVFGLEEKYGGTFFGIGVTEDLKQSQTLTWTNQTNTSITYTTTETDSLSITGPSCTGSPCSPAYTGPAEFQVFQDNMYGTFMFNPIN